MFCKNDSAPWASLRPRRAAWPGGRRGRPSCGHAAERWPAIPAPAGRLVFVGRRRGAATRGQHTAGAAAAARRAFVGRRAGIVMKYFFSGARYLIRYTFKYVRTSPRVTTLMLPRRSVLPARCCPRRASDKHSTAAAPTACVWLPSPSPSDVRQTPCAPPPPPPQCAAPWTSCQAPPAAPPPPCLGQPPRAGSWSRRIAAPGRHWCCSDAQRCC
jgi:hypothetical protein